MSLIARDFFATFADLCALCVNPNLETAPLLKRGSPPRFDKTRSFLSNVPPNDEVKKQREFWPEEERLDSALIALNKDETIRTLEEAATEQEMESFRASIAGFRDQVSRLGHLTEAPQNGSSVTFVKEVLLSELDQILDSRTIERARYYLNRLQKGVSATRTSGLNDINLLRWKEYDEVVTDSLWLLPKRDSSGSHLGWYWGNFVPQIPHQLMLRYTKRDDWVLDPFLGSGTTLIECRRMGRNGLGVELSENVGQRAGELIESQSNKYRVETAVRIGDSQSIDLKSELEQLGTERVQLVIMHPPYHDIIQFTEDQRDLSNAAGTESFLEMFLAVLDNVSSVLEKGRYLAVVIGDKYADGEWIPLGFLCMNQILQRGFSLKSVIVKNFDQTRAKREQKQLWRYRALVGGFYIFKHEYILLFRKK